MPISFANIIYLYKNGFNETFDKLTDEEEKTILKIREIELDKIFEKQFVLSYYMNYSNEDTKKMTPFEIDKFVQLLVKQKETEAELTEQELKNK